MTNGNGWAFEKPKPIEALYKMLEAHALRTGCNFIENEKSYKLFNLPKGNYRRYWGNFEDYSYAFDLITKRDSSIDKSLRSLFRANRKKHQIKIR
jgi:hypothetical protein